MIGKEDDDFEYGVNAIVTGIRRHGLGSDAN